MGPNPYISSPPPEPRPGSITSTPQSAGYSTGVVHLHSVGTSPPQPDFTADVQTIRSRFQLAASNGKKVVVVAQSYGGIPATEAIRDLDWETRQRNGLPGGVIHLFLCCSFIVSEGGSLISSVRGTDPPWWQVSSDRRIVTPATPEEVFYNDMRGDDGCGVEAAELPGLS
ncbi:hypothetical protein BDW62DRAFT_200813 [Aspergillus aurantiobrunneus]